MELTKYEKTLGINGVIHFKLKELGKLYKNSKDITELAIDYLLRKHETSDGVYLIIEESSNWKRIAKKLSNQTKLYKCDFLEILEQNNENS